MGRLGWMLAVVLLAGALSADADDTLDESRARAYLSTVRRDAGDAAWVAAVEALAAGSEEQRDALYAQLEARAKKRHAAWRAAAAKVDALTARVGSGAREDAARRAWEDARETACLWLFDEQHFPVPTQVVISGPMEGYGEAKRRGDAAVKTWRTVTKRLDRALKPVLSLSPSKADALDAAERSAAAHVARVLAPLPPERQAPFAPPSVDPFARVLLALRRHQWEQAAEAYAGLAPGWRRLLLFRAWCETLLAWNDDHPCGMDKGALQGIRTINDYRVALGISPVVHHEKLVEMAHGHSLEMTKKGFFSHRSPTPGRETKEARAVLAGYGARIVECIAGVGGGAAAVEFWKYDGGHHRDMIGPQWVEGGMSTRGPATYNGGAGDEGALPALRY